MTTIRRSALALAAVCWMAGLGCGDRPVADGPARDDVPHASASIAPSEIRIGDRAVLEVLVVSSPDRRLLPFATPESLTGFEILAVEALPLERRSGSWFHRTRVQLRARDVGDFEWPRANLELVGADGASTAVSLERVPLQVRSILPAYPGRSEPFGARAVPERATAAHPPTGIAIGGFSAILLGLLALARHRRRRRALSERAPAAEPAWSEALSSFGRPGPGAEPADAANAMAAALRRYMARRFGTAAGALTSEELAHLIPPFAATSRWPTFVSLLLDLDALRFRPRRHAGPQATDAARIEGLRSRARAFIEDSIPPEALR